jgi:hypothetical protein
MLWGSRPPVSVPRRRHPPCQALVEEAGLPPTSARTTREGRSSYQFLVDSAVAAARASARPVDILDLACGDGYLVQECLRQLGEETYLVSLLDAEAKESLRRRLIDVVAEHERTHRTLEMAFPLRLLTVEGTAPGST